MRWTTLASKSANPALVALYSQVTDLRVDGEWTIFEQWRNHLEHQFLLVMNEDTAEDLWNARQGTFGALCIQEDTFSDHTLRLLQFTRAAIFHFVWCVRHEAQDTSDKPHITLTLEHKRRDARTTPKRKTPRKKKQQDNG